VSPAGRAAWLAGAAGLLVAATAQQGTDVEALRRAIDEHRERVGAFERQERGLLETLESMDLAAQALAGDAAKARREARAARTELGALAERASDLEQRSARTQRALGARAVALYKSGDLGPVQAVFSAGSLREALGRLQSLRRLVVHDQALLDRYREETEALARTRRETEAAARRRDQAAARLEQRRRDVARESEARRLVLSEVRADGARARAALAELEAAARALGESITELESTPRRTPAPPRGGFAALRGRLEAPVEGSVRQGFGRVVEQEFQTQTVRKGVEFAAPLGAPVHAVADGEVRFAGWFRGYGKIVILDHGDGYFTVSGHLDEIGVEAGEVVSVGEPLGTAGETGSLSGPGLYFEVRKGSEALDPGDWLLQ
jgi:septal ring factor EnvC (AmiA/AmiB activator)